MNRFYRVVITKRPIGTAIEHREPEIQGTIITKVTDSATAGDYKLIVVDATDDEHKANLAQPGVQEISEGEADDLAPRYQPQRAFTRFDPEARREERVTIPAADLKKFVGQLRPRPRARAAQPRPARRRPQPNA